MECVVKIGSRYIGRTGLVRKLRLAKLFDSAYVNEQTVNELGGSIITVRRIVTERITTERKPPRYLREKAN